MARTADSRMRSGASEEARAMFDTRDIRRLE